MLLFRLVLFSGGGGGGGGRRQGLCRTTTWSMTSCCLRWMKPEMRRKRPPVAPLSPAKRKTSHWNNNRERVTWHSDTGLRPAHVSRNRTIRFINNNFYDNFIYLKNRKITKSMQQNDGPSSWKRRRHLILSSVILNCFFFSNRLWNHLKWSS